MSPLEARKPKTIFFLRYGAAGNAHGPFDTRAEALAWVMEKGEPASREGFSFKVYEAYSP